MVSKNTKSKLAQIKQDLFLLLELKDVILLNLAAKCR